MYLHCRTAHAVFLAACLSLPAFFTAQPFGHDEGPGIRHVLLVSIDGMHAVDLENCARSVN